MSIFARSMTAFLLLVTAAQGQPASPNARELSKEAARLIEPPPTRTDHAFGEQPRRTLAPAVQPAAHTQPLAAPSHGDVPLPLRASANPQRLKQDSRSQPSGTRATTTVATSLGVVLAAFFLLVWLTRKAAPKGLAPLPAEVFESLGRAPLSARQQLQLVRLGNKLVLLSVTPTGTEPLAEITDVDEVSRLTGLCQQARSGSISETFRQVLSQYAEEPAPGGFVGDPSLSQAELANRRAHRTRRREAHRA